MTPDEIFSKNQILSVLIATNLKGKKIACTSPEYHMNRCHCSEFIVGEIISRWDLAARELMTSGKFNNRQDYWKSYMTDLQIDREQTTLCLLDSNGQIMFTSNTKYDNFFDIPVFTGSDADRPVYFIEL